MFFVNLKQIVFFKITYIAFSDIDTPMCYNTKKLEVSCEKIVRGDGWCLCRYKCFYFCWLFFSLWRFSRP